MKSKFITKTNILKYFVFICTVIITTSCAPKMMMGTFTRDYNKNVSSFESNLSVDEVWSKVIDFFSEKGIGIQTLEKSSGIIVSIDYSFRNRFTIEEGTSFKDSTAWVVCNCPYFLSEGNGAFKTEILYPTNDLGNFNVRVKSENQKTKISVNLVNLRLYGTSNQSSSGFVYVGQQVPIQGFSTGVFEKMFMKYVDKNAKKL
ncbi:hypothetical protein PQG22_08975 [Aquirufa beregesia]